MTVSEPAPEPDPRPEYHWKRRLALGWILLALFAAMLAERILQAGGLEETALFYVGLPALIALLVTFGARPRSPVGVALCVTTIGLALAGPLLNEGVVCLILSAPLFYGIAALLGWMVGRDARNGGYQSLLVLPLLGLVSLEGVAETSLLTRETTGRDSGVVAASADEVQATLAAPPDYAEPRSRFLRTVPFPTPVRATGHGLEVGDHRTVEFTDRESLGIGAEPQERSMELRIVDSTVTDTGGHVVFTVETDSTLARWLDLHTAEVTWQERSAGTELNWQLHYTRTYDPSWYFGPLQRYAMDEAAGYLRNTFTPGRD
ncbi:hypothetical protein RIF23_04320 [Lipingzhangella sp. LS1_29]|uniref:Polyketide cyclase/dehydrase/lipid transport protein n=1 Tax=Lipingzhangella rawalii TaxID=2055835 RepID=A0ABU2H3U2_9ACTN|nr:hypothetical protein [Lipingzhangella rawalii]MDS1269520.1 hypothetical protein [Lipingzhangella rawalii]